MRLPKKFLVIQFLLSIFFIYCIRAGEILFFLTFTATSHKIFLKPFMEVLASRGHKVTLITNFDKPLSPNITEIKIDIQTDFYPILNNMYFHDYPKKVWQMFRQMELYFAENGFDDQFRNEKVLEMIKKGKKFDVVFTGALFEEYNLPTAALLGDNIIFIHFMKILPSFAYELDMIQPYSYIPSTLTPIKDEMTFIERLWNAIVSFHSAVILRDLTKMDKNYAKNIPDAPTLADVHSQISLMFLNSDPVTHTVGPVMPHVIPVGGMNCRDAQPLPQHLEEIMRSSGDFGVIYFSLGTFVDLRRASKDLPEIFLNVFSRLNHTVLWKADFQMEGLPYNVKIMKWVPQQDVLGHPKTRLYITQGGIFSLQEAIFHSIPVIGLPAFGDQFSNIARMEELGLGIHLDIFNLKPEELYSAITQILNDQRYYERSRKYSAIFKDQEQTPMERAVYWTEFLINHPRSFSDFRFSSKKQTLIQYHSLDVLLVLGGLFFITVFIIFKLVICIKIKLSI